ncbi:AAA-like domain-containing protein [Scytonema sp. PRP1]|uniref:AAA-like domain-containing protein n=1 Tax=Scytonema sp. PRP1 TaxID=3120513 RepID=UPI00300CBF4B
MNKEQVITKFKGLPSKRRMVLEKVLQGDQNDKIMCDLQIADDALSQHLRLLYKDFGLSNGMGERERKRHQLINLIRNAVPDIVELIKEGTLIVLNRSSEAEQPPLKEQTTKASLYVERPPIEQCCYDLIKQPDSLIRLKAPSRMGKTWLMQEILQKAERYNYRQVRLNLLLADEEIFSSLDKFLRWFCNNISLQLQLPTQINYEWDENLGSNPNCTNYFEKCLLAQIDHKSALVLGLDNVDCVFPYSTIASPFFGLLRHWFELARTHEIWRKLRLVIAYSTDVYIPLEIYESPFNVGIEFELRPFKEYRSHGISGTAWTSFKSFRYQSFNKPCRWTSLAIN